MSPPVAQTPGAWVKAGGGVGWSADCRAALIACGVNPDNFGTYKDRAESQSAARQSYRDQRDQQAEPPTNRAHESGCPRPTGGTCNCHATAAGFNDMCAQDGNSLRAMEANSQSGHISNDAMYRAPGKDARGDPCSNIRPSSPPPNAGGFGYQGDKALCMDHFGEANDPGSMHYEITRREANQSKAIREGTITDPPSAPSRVVTDAQMKEGAAATADIAVEGADSRRNGSPNPKWDTVNSNLTPDQQDANKESSERQKRLAKDLQAKEGQSGTAGDAGKTDAGNPNSPSGPGPTDAQKKKAKECITEAWEKSVVAMRNEAINKHSTVGKSDESKAAVEAHNNSDPKPNPPAEGFTDLPPAKQKELREQLAEKTKARQAELADPDKLNADGGKANNPPTKDDCLEFQANWLDKNRDANGNLLPMQGSPQRVGGPGDTPESVMDKDAQDL